MSRRYDSSRRQQAAEQTRQEILRAALRLHWEGVTELEPLAREAGCSLATVRKHFPTKEALFQGCTARFAESFTAPDLQALGSITEPGRRLEASVAELCRVHETMFGYAWLSARLQETSPTLHAELRAYEELADAVTAIIVPASSPHASTVRGLLDFLTYRALRISGQLSPAETCNALITTLRGLLPADGNFVLRHP